MSFFISLGIVLIAMLILACLQLRPGIFTLFYHYASGKYSKARTSDMTLFFILGAETANTCLFLCSYLFANFFFLCVFRPEASLFVWVIAGILLALALASFFCYYRSTGTQLFLPRKCVHNIDYHARSAKSRSDSFLFGALSGIYELPFTLPLYIISAIEITEMTVEFAPNNLLTILYVIVPVIPLFIIRWRFKMGQNLADIQKIRVKDKNFNRIILGFGYIAIAILLIYFRIIS